MQKINTLEPEVMAYTDADFAKKTDEFRRRISGGETLDSVLPEAYALVREAARRKLGERIFDVQLMGAVVLHKGRITEMKTGEGKTLASVPGSVPQQPHRQGVHVITVNDYLAERDAAWMGPIFGLLGVSVGVILSQMDNVIRKESYSRDITYGTNNEFGFDYLRDNMCWSPSEKVQRGHAYAIVDEIDNLLIDEARTPLIISGMAEDDTFKFAEVNKLVEQMVECEKDPDGHLPRRGNSRRGLQAGGEEQEGHVHRPGHEPHRGAPAETRPHQGLPVRRRELRVHPLLHPGPARPQAVREGRRLRRPGRQGADRRRVHGRILYGRRYRRGCTRPSRRRSASRSRAHRTLATITFQKTSACTASSPA